MRFVLAYLLASILASCPILCGTAHALLDDAGHLHQDAADDGPAPQPVNDDHCVCNGALKVDAASACHAAPRQVGDLPALPLAFVPFPTTAPLPSPLHPPSDPAEGVRPSRLRAQLQHFRC